MADILAGQRIRIWNADAAGVGNGKDIGIVQAYPLFNTITDNTKELDLVTIHDTFGTPVGIPIAGVYLSDPSGYTDGDAVPLLMDSQGKLIVSVSAISLNYEYVDDSPFAVTTDKVGAIGAYVDEITPDTLIDGKIGIPRMTPDRKLLTRIVGSDDANRWEIDASGLGQINIAGITSINPILVSKNSNVNAESNPLYVQVVKAAVSGTEVHDYDTIVTVKGLTQNYDYPVSGSVFLLRSVIVSASGAWKADIKVGPVGNLATKCTGFGSPACPTYTFNFDPPIEVPVASTGTARVTVRNDDNADMNTYVTIIGNDIP